MPRRTRGKSWQRESVMLAGVADREKFCADVTTRVTDALCVVVAFTPVIVSGYVPSGAVASVVMANCEPPAPVTVVGVRVALPTVDGRPASESATAPVKPLIALTVTV